MMGMSKAQFAVWHKLLYIPDWMVKVGTYQSQDGSATKS